MYILSINKIWEFIKEQEKTVSVPPPAPQEQRSNQNLNLWNSGIIECGKLFKLWLHVMGTLLCCFWAKQENLTDHR